MRRKTLRSLASLFLIAGLSLAIAAPAFAAGAGSGSQDDDYDRLDGTGLSAKRVNVIEWEGNLEIHVYPKGGLKGLALKLDKRNKDKPVMVIGYRFDSRPREQLVRRAILGIDLREGFRAYHDPSEPEFDKIIISNNGLSGRVVAYGLEPGPEQLYPDGHPALAKAPAGDGRVPASDRKSPPHQPRPALDPETGTIRPFYMDPERVMNRR